MIRIESLLSARLFLVPQIAGDRIFFISNLSGRLSLYVMDHGGSVPEPLLPPHIALQNPHLVGGYSYYVFPELGQIVVMIDQDGDENYQPMAIPMEGGFPEPALAREVPARPGGEARGGEPGADACRHGPGSERRARRREPRQRPQHLG